MDRGESENTHNASDMLSIDEPGVVLFIQHFNTESTKIEEKDDLYAHQSQEVSEKNRKKIDRR